MMVILGAKNGGGLAKTDVEVDHWKKSFFVELSAYRQSTFPPRASYANHKKHEQSDCDRKTHEEIQFEGSTRILLPIALQL